MKFFKKRKKYDYLVEVCEARLKDEDVQPGYPMYGPSGKRDKKTIDYTDSTGTKRTVEVTWCHYYAYKVLKEMGYAVDLLLEPIHNHIGWTTVQYMFDKAVELSSYQWSIGNVKMLDLNSAQVMANNGVPILILSRNGLGHAGILAPKTSDDTTMVYNAGSREVMGKKSLYEAFLKWEQSPLFFQIQREAYVIR